MRNSSLVKRFCAENVTGLKPSTEATGFRRFVVEIGRGAFCTAEKADREDRWSVQK